MWLRRAWANSLHEDEANDIERDERVSAGDLWFYEVKGVIHRPIKAYTRLAEFEPDFTPISFSFITKILCLNPLSFPKPLLMVYKMSCKSSVHLKSSLLANVAADHRVPALNKQTTTSNASTSTSSASISSNSGHSMASSSSSSRSVFLWLVNPCPLISCLARFYT
jgi:hypothetical protein